MGRTGRNNEELLAINQELRMRNDQLSEANAFAEAMLGTIREATLVLTADLRIKSANPMFYTLFGLNEAETEGRLIYELANRQWDIPQLRSLLTDVATRDAQVQGFELTYDFPGVGEKVLFLNARRVVRQQEAILLAIEDITGHRRLQHRLEEREAWFRFDLSAVKNRDGITLTCLNSTDRKRAEEQIERLRQMKQTGETVDQLSVLHEEVRTRGELLRMSSHDLRGSLGVIQGAADLLFYADSDQERSQMLDMIQRNVQQTTRLITELLDLSRLEAGQQSVAFAPFDAADLLRKLGENVRPLVERKGLALELSGEEPLRVEGDSLNVFRMAQNVVLNALKYTEQGSIGVRWGTTGPDEWFFDVDTGPGMEQDTAHRLSHEIAVDAANSAGLPSVPGGELLRGSAPGEGIGLVIVRQLCQLLRGRLVIDGRPGRGSTFRVLLPRQY